MILAMSRCSGRLEIALGIMILHYANPVQTATSLVAVFVALRRTEESIKIVITRFVRDSRLRYSKLVNDSDGLARLMVIAKSRRKYTTKTLRATHQILAALWRFSELREVYKQEGYKEADFLCKSMLPRSVVT